MSSVFDIIKAGLEIISGVKNVIGLAIEAHNTGDQARLDEIMKQMRAMNDALPQD